MDRRKFLQGVGAIAALATVPNVSLGNPPPGPRIITNDMGDMYAKCFRVMKGGKQVGLVYWANLDTKEYRRSALMVDLAEGNPWEGEGRIVRHQECVGKSKITHTLGAGCPQIEKSYTYRIDQYPVVDYPALTPYRSSNSSRVSPLSVEGTFDEVVLSDKAPAEVRAQYPDLRVLSVSKG